MYLFIQSYKVHINVTFEGCIKHTLLSFIPVCVSQVCKDTLNPVWRPFQVAVHALCSGNKSQPIQVREVILIICTFYTCKYIKLMLRTFDGWISWMIIVIFESPAWESFTHTETSNLLVKGLCSTGTCFIHWPPFLIKQGFISMGGPCMKQVPVLCSVH